MILDALRQALRAAITQHHMLSQGERVMAAVSGGGDSVALLRLLHGLRDDIPFELIVAHVNHGLRGAAGDADARFVQELAASLSLVCVVLSPGPREEALLARARGSEEAARRARHMLLAAAARRAGCGRIALGHTMDDQAETVLMRLIRGTGRRGLSGMRRCGPGLLIRPLLGLRRDALRSCLRDLGQPFREDETNQDARFLRNRVRVRLIPVLAGLNPAIVESLARTAELLAEEDRYLDDLARREVTRWARPASAAPAEASVRIPAANLNALPLPLRRRAARMLLAQAGGDPRGAGSRAVADLLDLAAREGSGAGLDLPGGIRTTLQEGLLLLELAGGRNLPSPFCVDMLVPGEVALPGGRGALRARRIDAADFPGRLEAARREGALDVRTVFLDATALGSSPCVRSRLRGDAFRPMGGAGSRKVSDYLIDRKVPRTRRDEVPLVVGGAGIAWVVGFRASEEYRVTPDSGQVVELEWDRGEGWLA